MIKRPCFYLLSLVIFLLLVSVPSSSFLIRPHPDARHHEVVDKALLRMGGFADFAKSTLKNGSEVPDGSFPWLIFSGKWPDWAHFLLGSSDPGQVLQEWQQTYSNLCWLRNESTLSAQAYDSPSAYTTLGCIFHTISDFYSHTNWIRLHDFGATADFTSSLPPSGLGNDGIGDSSSNFFFTEAFEDAIRSCVKEWYLYEDRLYGSCEGPNCNLISVLLNNQGVSSQISFYRPRGEFYTVFGRKVPAEGYIKGTFNKIIWYQTAIPHDMRIKIELWKDGERFGDITTIEDDAPFIHNNEFEWDFYTCYEDDGVTLKDINPDNSYPRYQIRIATYDYLGSPNYEQTSKNFYIAVPTYGGPTELTAEPYAWNAIQLTWHESSNCETGFEVWRRKEGDASFSLLKTLGPNYLATIDNTVLPDTTYYYLVKEKFVGRDPIPSNGADGRVTSAPPEEFNDLEAEMDWTFWRVKLTWADNSQNEQGYKVERRSEWEPEFTVVDSHVMPNTTTWYDSQTSNDTIYYYRVKVYNPSGYCYSPEAWVYVGIPGLRALSPISR